MLLTLFTGCARSADPYSNRWEQLSAEHYRLIATDDGAAWERAFLPVHNAFWRDVVGSCGDEAKKAGIAEFRAVAVIDGSGKVTEFLTMPNSQHLKCFSEQMVGRKYPAPPVAPFYEVYTVSLPNK